MPPLPDRLTIDDVAADLGLPTSTVRTYRKRAERNRLNGIAKAGDLPPADASIGRTPAWTRQTYLRWKANRPGRGKGGGRHPAQPL